jgi:Lar family restriction alleviation protein
MSKIKLLPCPFCGGEAEIISSCFFGWDKQIICKKCGASTRYLCGVTPSQATKNAVKKWNTRKPMERIAEQIEFLEHRTIDGVPYINMNDAIEIVKEEGGIE